MRWHCGGGSGLLDPLRGGDMQLLFQLSQKNEQIRGLHLAPLLIEGEQAVIRLPFTTRHLGRLVAGESRDIGGSPGQGGRLRESIGRRTMILHLVPVVLLSKQLAHLLDYRVRGGGLPVELVGLVVAILILAPEGLAAIKAAARNQMQRSVNVLLGSVLATIGLTVPAALAIGILSGKPVLLGLSPAYVTLLAVTLGSCFITFGQGQTNILQGFVHLLLFIAYIVLMFD